MDQPVGDLSLHATDLVVTAMCGLILSDEVKSRHPHGM
jgi:hypothetical protein